MSLLRGEGGRGGRRRRRLQCNKHTQTMPLDCCLKKGKTQRKRERERERERKKKRSWRVRWLHFPASPTAKKDRREINDLLQVTWFRQIIWKKTQKKRPEIKTNTRRRNERKEDKEKGKEEGRQKKKCPKGPMTVSSSVKKIPKKINK